MVAAFSGLFIGTSAIHAAQRGLDVTGQNIANSATPGYSRQRVDLESVGGPGVPAFWSRYDGTGEGVKVTGVSRMTDSFLVARANDSSASLGSLEEQQKTMAAVERTIDEPSDTGLKAKLADFWNSFSKVGNDPKSIEPKNLAYESAEIVANHLNHMSNTVTTQWKDTRAELEANVTEINSLARDVAKLNEAIRNNNIAKVPSNELLDQRDQMIARLAELTGATAQPAELDADAPFNSQAVDVWVGGHKLVDATHANSLQVTGPTENADGEDDQVSVTWATVSPASEKDPNPPAIDDPAMSDAPTGTNAAATDGTSNKGRVAGMLLGLNKTIPGYVQQFDQIAQQLADTVNLQQVGDGSDAYPGGYTYVKTGDDVESEEGQALFTDAFGGTTAITAANIQLRSGSSAKDIAVSKGDPEGDPPSLDGDNALAMAAHLRDQKGPGATYAGMVIQLGVDVNSVNTRVLTQQNVVQKAEDARDNVSGVSLNEEMTNMIQFQHSFSAAAKYVSTIDQILDTLINMKR